MWNYNRLDVVGAERVQPPMDNPQTCPTPERVLDLESGPPGSDSVTCQLYDLGQVTFSGLSANLSKMRI